jgi:hypothetical protein
MIPQSRKIIILAGFAAILLAATPWRTPAARAGMPYDGAWSVLIVTDVGTCDPAYRYALRIVNGRITYPDQSFSVSGNVDAHGHVNVSVSNGQQHANGTGELAGDQGTGMWSGRSPTSLCSGHWQAERRG